MNNILKYSDQTIAVKGAIKNFSKKENSKEVAETAFCQDAYLPNYNDSLPLLDNTATDTLNKKSVFPKSLHVSIKVGQNLL
ncbi:hypothetical protein HDU92_006697 [Lobulomyces angularis]|nr:hypothetical protein HDU92_006697 [Lobulomyces angularis]